MKPPPIIDVDCNLWHPDLKNSLYTELTDGSAEGAWTILKEDAVSEANIVAMLSPSTTIQEAQAGLALLTSNPPPLSIKTTVGVHPYHVNDEEFEGKSLEEHKETIKGILTCQETTRYCAAVGECGLDASEGFPPLDDQIPWFQMQIEIAQDLSLPLFVHERLAFEQTMKMLDKATVPVIIHCFTGTKEECVAYVQRGYFISISGYIMKERNDNCAEVISCLKERVIPLDKLMIETDAPYMGFADCRQLYLEHNPGFLDGLNSKKRKRLQTSTYPNVPSSLPKVLEKVTECLKSFDSSLTVEAVAEATTANARSLFQL
jgi:TatD DNase family protein